MILRLYCADAASYWREAILAALAVINRQTINDRLSTTIHNCLESSILLQHDFRRRWKMTNGPSAHKHTHLWLPNGYYFSDTHSFIVPPIGFRGRRVMCVAKITLTAPIHHFGSIFEFLPFFHRKRIPETRAQPAAHFYRAVLSRVYCFYATACASLFQQRMADAVCNINSMHTRVRCSF